MVRRRYVRAACLAGCVILVAGLAAGVWQAFGRPHPPEPPTPAPPPQRTTAELLVGTWRWVRLSDLVGPPSFSEMTFEYTRDGRVIIRIWYHAAGESEPQTGTYRLDGDVLHMDITHPPKKVRSSSTRIVKLDDKVFVNTDADTTGRFIAEYERVVESP